MNLHQKNSLVRGWQALKVGMSPSRIAQPYTPHLTITIVTNKHFLNQKLKKKLLFFFVCVCVCFIIFLGSFFLKQYHSFIFDSFLVLCNWWDIFNHYYYYYNYSMHVCVIDSMYTYCPVYVTFSLSGSQLPIIVCGLMIFTFTYIYNRILFSIYDQFN